MLTETALSRRDPGTRRGGTCTVHDLLNSQVSNESIDSGSGDIPFAANRPLDEEQRVNWLQLKRALKICSLLVLVATQFPAVALANPKVKLQTSMGVIVIELDPDRAPITVSNFIQYVKEGHYAGTIFHRVVPGFVVQGGGYTAQGELKPTHGAVINESGNGLSNLRGTVGMARSNVPHGANCQFYINLSDNPALDPQPARWGYAVFGHVIEGMNIADKMSDVPTGKVKPFEEDAPLKPIVIEKAEVIGE
jgi:cyclophilin family peptidyl-prolyl cis-trans isomerase